MSKKPAGCMTALILSTTALRFPAVNRDKTEILEEETKALMAISIS
jgi:hypothetical protein